MARDELVTVLDGRGAPVGVAHRWRVRAENLRHAATAVLVRSSDGRIYVTRRSEDKDWAPGHHDAAAGGVLQVGEEPEASARRELEEELGITGVTLRSLLVTRYEDATVRCVTHAYETTYDGAVRFADGEVVWGGWMTLLDVGRHLGDPAWPFVPDTRALLSRLARESYSDYGALELDTEERRPA